MARDEKRRYSRLKTEVKVDISYTDPETDVTSLLTRPVSKNVSASGLLIRHNKPLAVGSDVVLKFLLPEEKRYVMTFAKIVRVDAVEEGKAYDIGICFTNARLEDIERINKYISSSLKKPRDE